MKFKLAHPSATLNIVLTEEELAELVSQGSVRPSYADQKTMYDEIYEPGACSGEAGAPKWIQFLSIRVEKKARKTNDHTN